MSEALFQLIQLIKQLGQYDQQQIPDLPVAIEYLQQIYNAKTKSIARHIDRIITILQLYLTEKHVVQLYMANFLDIVIETIMAYPKLATKNKNRCIRVLKICLNILTKISQQIPESWLNPPNGYTDKFKSIDNPTDHELQLLMLPIFNIFVRTIDRNAAASLFQPIFKQYLSIPNDWRYPYSALVLASQISGKSLKMQAAHFYVESAIMHFESPYPKVRYACLHLIGLFSDEMNPQFQQKYYESILPPMIKLLKDPIPRVVAHNLASLANVFENINNQVWKIQYCIGQILPVIMFYLNSANTWIMQCAMATLSSFAFNKDALGPNLAQILEITNTLIHTYAGIPEYTLVVNICFEILSSVVAFQNRNEVQQYLPNIVALMLQFRVNMSDSYFLNCWSRICLEYQSFTDIDPVFNHLLNAAQNILKQQNNPTALQGLTNICKSFKVSLKPYVYSILALARQIFEDKNKQNILKQQSIRLIKNAIINIKPSTPQYIQEWKKLVIDAISYIFNSVEKSKQENYPQLQCLYRSLRYLIKASIQIFSQAQIQQITARLQASLAKIQKNYIALQSQNEIAINDENELQSNESQVMQLKNLLSYLQQCIQQTSVVYQALLQSSNPSAKQWLINVIAKKSSLQVTKSKCLKLHGIDLLLSLVEKCQYLQISGIWGNLMHLFVSNSDSPHARIRNSAVYGMGVVILKTPIEQIQQANINQWLQCIWKAYSLPYEEDIQDQGSIKHSRDNVVSTLGKLIYRYSNKFATFMTKSLYQHWFSQLPLNFDKFEGDIQQHYLNQLVITNPEVILGNAQDLKSILVEYYYFVKKRHNYKGKEIMQQTKETLKIITSWPIFKQSEEFLWSNLTKSQINILTRFMGK